MDKWFWQIQSSTCPLCRYDVAASPADNEMNENDESLCFCLPTNTTISSSTTTLEDKQKLVDDLGLFTTVVLTGDIGDEKANKMALTFSKDRINAFGDNFDLIMAKALHARRARLTRQSSSFISIIDDEE